MTGKDKLDISRLVDRPDMVIVRGTSPRMTGVPIVVFAAAALPTRTAETLELVGLLAPIRRPVYWIADPGQSWYAAPGFVDRACAAIGEEMARLGAVEIDTIGNSMGAYGALAFAERLSVRTAIAMGTRFSPDVRIVPDHRLHNVLRPYLDSFPFPTISAGMSAAGQAVLVHGDEGPDRPHVLAIDPPENTEHWVLAQCDHFVAKTLRERDQLKPFLHAALRQDRAEMRNALRAARAMPASDARAGIERKLSEEQALKARQAASIVNRMKAVLRPVKQRLKTLSQPSLRAK